jgi:hypothetical protein
MAEKAKTTKKQSCGGACGCAAKRKKTPVPTPVAPFSIAEGLETILSILEDTPDIDDLRDVEDTVNEVLRMLDHMCALSTDPKIRELAGPSCPLCKHKRHCKLYAYPEAGLCDSYHNGCPDFLLDSDDVPCTNPAGKQQVSPNLPPLHCVPLTVFSFETNTEVLAMSEIEKCDLEYRRLQIEQLRQENAIRALHIQKLRQEVGAPAPAAAAPKKKG